MKPVCDGEARTSLSRLLDRGIGASDLYRISTVPPAMLRGWARGEGRLDAHIGQITRLAEFLDQIEECPGIRDAVVWLEMPLPGSFRNGMDIVVAGHCEDLRDYAMGKIGHELLLDRSLAEWRADDAFQVFTATDGIKGVRPWPPNVGSLPSLPEGVSHDEIIHALEKSGWMIVGERTGAYRRLKKDLADRHAESLVVPTDPSSPNYESEMHTVLMRLSRLEPEVWGWLRYADDAAAQTLILVEAAAAAGCALDAQSLHALVGEGLHDPASLSVKGTMSVADLLRDRAASLRSRAEALDGAAQSITNMAANGHRLGEMS